MSAKGFLDGEPSTSHQGIRLSLIFSITAHFLFLAILIVYSELTQISPKNIVEALSVSISLNSNSTSPREKNLGAHGTEKHKNHLKPQNDNQNTLVNAKTTAPAEPTIDIKTLSNNNAPQKYKKSINLDRAKNQITQLAEAIAKPEHRIRYIQHHNDSSLAEENYLRSWREKCEEIGRRNYPKGRLEGQVTTRISIASDGSLIEAMIIKSSGIASIDEAVIQTIQQASPFQPFNIEMRRKYDFIEFIRLWQFSNARQIIY